MMLEAFRGEKERVEMIYCIRVLMYEIQKIQINNQQNSYM